MSRAARYVSGALVAACLAAPADVRAGGAGHASLSLVDQAWIGGAGELQWRWSTMFARPVHVGLVRARFGQSPTTGVPTELHWEALAPHGVTCDRGPDDDEEWQALDGAVQRDALDWPDRAQPTRRSWFVDADACGLRLVVDRTNAGPPEVREVRVVESARDVLLGQRASDDGSCPGDSADGAVDGTYARRWAGAPGKGRWTLRVDLASPEKIDRVRLVLGFDATTVPRGPFGRSYVMAWGPLRYTLEASEDGTRFEPIAREPRRADGSIVPLRRRLVRTPARTVRALRLVMDGATDGDGLPNAGAEPVVREIAAYRADDPHPVLAPPWVLSVNANPSAQAHREIGGEALNDAFHAKFLQRRFAPLLASMRRDDHFARTLGVYGEPRLNDYAGESLESIEADDPALDADLLASSSPPPITVLSGSNDWDYASYTRQDPLKTSRWYWDPLRDAKDGGMGRLGPAVAGRVAPILGFCGGAQLLALLEARANPVTASEDDQTLIDRVLKRITGHPIRGFATAKDMEWAWPSDPHPRHALISFEAADPLFADIADVAAPTHRHSTEALPEAHSDAVRMDAFEPGGPLARFDVVATSRYCARDVVAAGPGDGVVVAPGGAGWCDTVPEAFRSRDGGWPLVGAQFHPEQRQFASPGPGDPSESVEDPRLFFASAFEEIVDAYERNPLGGKPPSP
jgi:hypothetical protein